MVFGKIRSKNMRDFTFHTYSQLLNAIVEAGYEFQTFEEFTFNPKERVVILRHDSDKTSSSELEFAKYENKLGIRASYYFRIPKTFRINHIRKIIQLGHEIGYHYEDLSVTGGDYQKAILRFEKNLNSIRRLYPVKTIAMHGRPLSVWNSKDLWKKYDFRKFGIIAEPYISVDYKKVLYLTDTGSRWNGEKMIIRDSVLSSFNFNVHSTFQLIKLFQEKKLPDKIILNSHPARWNDNLGVWVKDYFVQQVKNIIKYFLKKIIHFEQTQNSFTFGEKIPYDLPAKLQHDGSSTVAISEQSQLQDEGLYDIANQRKNKSIRYCLLTNDVETTSIKYNRLSEKTGELVLKEGMPMLIDLYNKYKIKSTFFFTGQIAAKFPEIVRMILPYGHEVGCHGYSHEINEAFDVLSYEEQVNHLRKAKSILEDISGQEVVSFRAPALRVNKDTPRALLEAGFLIDSSVAPQRFDFLMTFGSRQKMNWLNAPRSQYKVNIDNLARKGDTQLLEIPLSALILPYIGTTMRVFPGATRIVRAILHYEAKFTGKPIVFLIHPNEFLNEATSNEKITRRTRSPIKYFMADLLRNKLKVRNLGNQAILLYDKEIEFFLRNQYEFTTIKDYALNRIP
jgi:peptidoglycan-N-acetylglucosamine deacetylase